MSIWSFLKIVSRFVLTRSVNLEKLINNPYEIELDNYEFIGGYDDYKKNENVLNKSLYI